MPVLVRGTVQMKQGKIGMSFRHAPGKLLVMEKGRIAEAGTHEELLAAGGLYSRMWKAQAENYVV